MFQSVLREKAKEFVDGFSADIEGGYACERAVDSELREYAGSQIGKKR